MTKVGKFWKGLMILIEKIFKIDAPQIFQWLRDVINVCINKWLNNGGVKNKCLCFCIKQYNTKHERLC